MNRPYPAFLRLYGRPALVVGGGAAALQRAIALGEAGARITIVARDVHPEMENVPGVVKIHRRPFTTSDITRGPRGRRPRLVVACSDETTNLRASRAAERAGVWATAPSSSALGSFILPAVAREGATTFAVGAGSGGPVLEKFLAGRLASAIGPSVSALVKALRTLGPRLKVLPVTVRRRLIEACLDRAALGGFRPGDGARLAREIRQTVRTLK